MPYGNGNSTDQNRMLELGSLAVSNTALAELRLRVISARRELATVGWPDDPTLPLDRKILDGRLLAAQSRITSEGLNSKWAEKARISVTTAITEQCSRARKTFAGRIAYLDANEEKVKSSLLPETLLERLKASDIEALQTDAASAGGLDALLQEARNAVVVLESCDTETCLLLPPRQAALAWLFGHVLRRFGQPDMDAPDVEGVVRSVVQLHLDKACLRPAKTAYPAVLKELSRTAAAVLRSGKSVTFDLPLTSVEARGDIIPLRLAMGKRQLLQALLTESRGAKNLSDKERAAFLADAVSGLRFRSLCLEIGPQTARVVAVVARDEPANSVTVHDSDKAQKRAKTALERAVAEGAEDKVAKAKQAFAAAETRHSQIKANFTSAVQNCKAVIGVDPGRREAIAATALCIPADVQLDPERLLSIGSLGRKPMRLFLSTHALVEPVRAAAPTSFDNAPFLDHMKLLADLIDNANAAISARYRRVAVLKKRLNLLLGCEVNALVPEVLPNDVPQAAYAAHRAMFRELARVHLRKDRRRALWERMSGVKRSWFGFLANGVAMSALALGAGVALEDGDWGIEKREGGDYKGKTWNRVMSAVAPRRLLSIIKARLDWSGVVWWDVAAWHTSKTDHRVGVVEAKQRPRGSKRFTALWDGMDMDADEHAAETMAATALMRPLDAAGLTQRDAVLAGLRLN